ncbi:MAG: group II intron reverse transcriptase/maturase [Actinobacteria bacterium]|nr:group II intron reverse transcriptase/maturase [Actinomycetota bacterium]
MNEPKPKTAKPFEISKWVVWDAYEKVKANQGAAGVDGESIAEYEKDLKGNLYKLWNRMSSGSYHPPPVRAVEIPKKAGGIRTLGVPTVADRIAQTVVRSYLEPEVEPLFHPDSYGYRPGRSAHQALAACRQRCWKYDWVIDLDIRAFFDSIPHSLLLKAVSKHTDLSWVLLYVKRWLEAPLQREDGTVVPRDRGTPQGSAISPVLANLFLHYAFDRFLAREFSGCPFERYADDAVVHCKSEAEAREVLAAISERMAKVGLELHPGKTRVVYCKDNNRKGSSEHEQFTFLGYTFRPRRSKGKHGYFVGFLPAVSNDAAKGVRTTIKRWRLHLRSDLSLKDLADWVNPIVRGWITYYGHFYKSGLYPSLQRINDYLLRWARRKYKRLRTSKRRAWAWLEAVARRDPTLFAHWRLGGALP